MSSKKNTAASSSADPYGQEAYADPSQYYENYDYSNADPSYYYNYDGTYDGSYDASQQQQYYDSSYYANYYQQQSAYTGRPPASAVDYSIASQQSAYAASPSAYTPVTASSSAAAAGAGAGAAGTPAVAISTSGYAGPNAKTSPTASPGGGKADKKKGKKKLPVRMAGGEVWEDPTLQDWDDNDFRLFAGDLGNEVTDELLFKAFSKYPSLQRTRVVRDKRTGKSRGYGFLSFKDPNEFVKAWREMNGKRKDRDGLRRRKEDTSMYGWLCVDSTLRMVMIR